MKCRFLEMTEVNRRKYFVDQLNKKTQVAEIM